MVGPALECSASFVEHCLDLHLMRLEAGQDIMVPQMHGNDGQLGSQSPSQAAPGGSNYGQVLRPMNASRNTLMTIA